MPTPQENLMQHFSLVTPVGWVKQSATQQSPGNVGFRSSNATCYPAGTLKANKSGNPSTAVAPQPTQFKVLALTQAY
ncbi:MAG: hypothetical protein HWQ35_12925 [Nostoc sp. NMS1]|uniref:hypothetical protein n=1 Tax=unclassified Nostoc TaxID=2593658 RepID=UPI0025FEA76A|nr:MULTISPECIES: hypothetical protein [unclassified Nostoc]MBN3907424.1 hypothetical protein [Nostoc sp. NMS1]MBN3994418.1 hypothetical protein [Nostoc sp. NMS2]